MRINVESSVFTEPRYKLLAEELGVSRFDVIGRMVAIWTACYEMRSKCLTDAEANACADHKQFTAALLKYRFATRVSDTEIEIHGVEKRIDFLVKQAEKGARGGRSGRPSEQVSHADSSNIDKLNRQANAYRPAKAAPEAKACGAAQAYSLALSPDLALTLSPDNKRERPRAVKAALPPDWKPKPDLVALGKSLGVDPERSADAMRDWADANAERKADWDAAFRSWLRRDAEKKRPHQIAVSASRDVRFGQVSADPQKAWDVTDRPDGVVPL